MKSTRNLTGLLWMFGGRVVLSGSQVLALIVLARLLNQRDFGLATIVITLSELSSWITTCGIGPALVQRPQVTRDHYATALIVALIGGISGGVISLCFAKALTWFFKLGEDRWILHWLLLTCPIAALRIVLYSGMQRNRNFRWISLTQSIGYFLGPTVTAIVLALLHFGPNALILGQVVFQGFAVVSYAYGLGRILFGIPRWCAFADLVRVGFGFGWAELLGWFANNADRLLISRVLDVDALGLYTRAYAIVQALLTFLTQPMEAVLFPAFARIQGKIFEVQRLFIKSLFLATLLTTSVAALLVAVPEKVISVLLGEKWLAAAPVLQIFGFFVLLRVCYRVTDFVVRAHGWVYRRLAIITIFSGVSVLGVWFGAKYGLSGVALGVSLSYFLPFFALAFLVLRQIPLTWIQYARMIVSAFLLLCTVGFIVHLLSFSFPSVPSFIELVVLGGLSAALTVGISWTLRRLLYGFGEDPMKELLTDLIGWVREQVKFFQTK